MKILHPEPLETWRSNGGQQEWLLKPFLMRSSSLMLYGRPGLGKTTLALQLAAALMGEQKTWLGFPVERPGPVLWLQLDMPRYEMSAMLDRAISAKLFSATAPMSFVRMYDIEDDYGYNVNVAAPLTEQEEVFDFNLLARADYDALADIIRGVYPVALFVDTVGDAYYSVGSKAINDEIRDVLRRLRSLMRPVGGAVVYLHHQRKRNPQLLTDDPDEFLGGMAWAGFASTSMQLLKSKSTAVVEEGDDPDDKFHLALRKVRLGQLGFDRFELLRNATGFFEPKWTAKHGILLWQDYLSKQWGGDMYETLSRQLGVTEEALRKAKSRLKEKGIL